MSDWLNDAIRNHLIAVYEDHYFIDDAIHKKPRTFGERRAEEIGWLRWMAANLQDKDMVENRQGILIPMFVCGGGKSCDPRLVLERFTEDPTVFVRRGVTQNRSTPTHLLIRLNADPDLQVGALVLRNAVKNHAYPSQTIELLRFSGRQSSAQD